MLGALAGGFEFGGDSVSLGLNDTEIGGQLFDGDPGLRTVGLGGDVLVAEVFEVGSKAVSLGDELLGALTDGLEFGGDGVSLGLNDAEGGGIFVVQVLGLCTGGVEVGSQLLDSGMGIGMLVTEALKIGLEAAPLGGSGLGLGQLVGQLSNLSSSGIEVGSHPIPFSRSLGQLAAELVGRLGGGSG